MMDAREKSEKEQLQFDCQSYHVPLIDEAPLFPVSALRGNNCCVSGLYLDGRPNHSHDINLFNGHLQKMFSLEQIFFFNYANVCQEFSLLHPTYKFRMNLKKK